MHLLAKNSLYYSNHKKKKKESIKFFKKMWAMPGIELSTSATKVKC